MGKFKWENLNIYYIFSPIIDFDHVFKNDGDTKTTIMASGIAGITLGVIVFALMAVKFVYNFWKRRNDQISEDYALPNIETNDQNHNESSSESDRRIDESLEIKNES